MGATRYTRSSERPIGATRALTMRLARGPRLGNRARLLNRDVDKLYGLNARDDLRKELL